MAELRIHSGFLARKFELQARKLVEVLGMPQESIINIWSACNATVAVTQDDSLGELAR